MPSLKRKPSDLTGGFAPEPGHTADGTSQRARMGTDDTTASGPRLALFTMSYPDVNQTNGSVRQTPFQKPTQLMTYSHDASHTQIFDNSAMRYYIDPPKGARLDCGYDQWIRKPDERGRLDGLLKAFLDMKARGGILPDSGVVSWRGIMTKILTAPYEERDGWELNIMSVNGVLYLEEHLTEARLEEKNNMAPRQRLQTYYGYAFESYCTSNSPTRRPGWGGDVNTNEQWCSVVKTKLGGTRVFIGGEVDCVRGRYTGNTDTFVELKTSMLIRGPQDEARFEKKLLKFYFQSFLLGVPEIVVGFRTPSGIVTTLQRFKTMEIPRQVRGKPGAWNPLVCLDFGDRFLEKVKETVSTEADKSRVWRAKFSPGTGVSMRLLEPEEVDGVVNEEDRVGLIPRWYWDEIEDGVTHAPDSRQSNVAPVSSGPPGSSPPPDPIAPRPPAATHAGWQI